MEDWLPIIEMMMRKERLCKNVSAISRHNWMSAVIKQNGNRYLGHKIYEFLNSKFCPHECSQNISILLVEGLQNQHIDILGYAPLQMVCQSF